MYVGTIVEYDDQSAISSLPVAEPSTQPLYLSLFTSDKGPEEWTECVGSDWFDRYGKQISFAKHGQPLLQTAISINAGARVLCKRLVASDATLGNLAVIVKVEPDSYQGKDAAGNLLYLDADGNITTTVTDTPYMIKDAKLTYTLKSIEGNQSNDPADIFELAKQSVTEPNSYLLYAITDIGRGVSAKRIAIVPNYRLSRSKSYEEYNLVVYEEGSTSEVIGFSPIPDFVTGSKDYSLKSGVNSNSKQIRAVQDVEALNNFAQAIADAAEKDISVVYSVDYLFGCDRKGVALNWIKVDYENGDNLQDTYGWPLLFGTNGIFGDSPLSEEVIPPYDRSAVSEYIAQAEYALGTDSNNVYDTCIYNLDHYKIDLCVDANYPVGVKNAIEILATFREDFHFMRDLGLGLDSFDKIDVAESEIAVKNKFISHYAISFDVIDPYSRKQISVTSGYEMARLMVAHMNAGRNLPCCGIKYGFVFTNAIPGTLNFSPTVCPEPLGNQKEAMEEIRVNYATVIGNDIVLETEYTSQEALTQFSFINNIIAVQEVVRAIRRRCPVIRYSFIDGEDLDRYKADIIDVLSHYTKLFKLLEFNYINDPAYINNKIFYAAINVCCRDFVQTEWFKVTAINIES